MDTVLKELELVNKVYEKINDNFNKKYHSFQTHSHSQWEWAFTMRV